MKPILSVEKDSGMRQSGKNIPSGGHSSCKPLKQMRELACLRKRKKMNVAKTGPLRVLSVTSLPQEEEFGPKCKSKYYFSVRKSCSKNKKAELKMYLSPAIVNIMRMVC